MQQAKIINLSIKEIENRLWDIKVEIRHSDYDWPYHFDILNDLNAETADLIEEAEKRGYELWGNQLLEALNHG